MWMKVFAVVSMGSVLFFGAALVSKAKAPVDGPPAPGIQRIVDASPVATISHGETVELAAHTDAGGAWTLFDFTADW